MDKEEFEREYIEYLKDSVKQLQDLATSQNTNPRTNIGVAWSSKPVAYKVQSALGHLAKKLETGNNVCVAVGEDENGKLYVAANKQEGRTLEQKLAEVFESYFEFISEKKQRDKKYWLLNIINSKDADPILKTLHHQKGIAFARSDAGRLEQEIATMCYSKGIRNLLKQYRCLLGNYGYTGKEYEILSSTGVDKNVHAEVKVLNAMGNEGKYLGISKICCPKCCGYLKGIFSEEDPASVRQQIGEPVIYPFRAAHSQAFASWTLPSPKTLHLKNAIGKDLYNKYCKTQEDLETAIDIVEKTEKEHLGSGEERNRAYSIASTIIGG